jgi:ADP-heptose:LPS heptosyltransferase
MINENKKILIENFLSSGDILMLTAAVRDLKKRFPNFKIDVNTSVPQIWENNPNITKLNRQDPEIEIIKADYPLINESDDLPYHFIHGFRMFFEDYFNIKIPQGPFHGEIFLSNEEKANSYDLNNKFGIKGPFWILISGGKYDYTAKWWSPIEYQKVINYFKNKITFVQCGDEKDFHPALNGAINLIGKTNPREFINLMYHSIGVVSPVTYAMHLAAAVESKYKIKNRPAVIIAGGRESTHWEAYPNHRFLSVVGALKCCAAGGCWKSRCSEVGDGEKDDFSNLCEYPTKIDFDIKSPYEGSYKKLFIPKCMDMIKAEDVINAINYYYESEAGILRFLKKP